MTDDDERRYQNADELPETNRHVPEDGAVTQPVCPADRESHGVAEGMTRVDVVPALPRQHRPELGEAHGAEQREQPADDPHEKNG